MNSVSREFQPDLDKAGKYGTGKRAGGVSTLICAVFEDRRIDEDDDEPKLVQRIHVVRLVADEYF